MARLLTVVLDVSSPFVHAHAHTHTQGTHLMEALCGRDGLLAHNRTLRGLHLAANSLGSPAVVRLLTTLATIRRNTLVLGGDDPGATTGATGAHAHAHTNGGGGGGGKSHHRSRRRREGQSSSTYARGFGLGKSSWVKGLFTRLTGGPSAPLKVVSVLRTLDLRANGLSSESVTKALVRWVGGLVGWVVRWVVGWLGVGTCGHVRVLGVGAGGGCLLSCNAMQCHAAPCTTLIRHGCGVVNCPGQVCGAQPVPA